MAIPSRPVANVFLAALPQDDYDLLRSHLEPVELRSRQFLFEYGQPIAHCYFVNGGMVSLLIPLEDGAMIETGVVGREGFAGLAALMSADDIATQTSMVQLPGTAVRIRTEILRKAMLRRAALLDRVLRFAQALSIQTSQTAACNAHHDLQERLARWLLMAHDRAEDDVLALTQEFVSMMLAVRRPGVTVAARSLQSAGAIDYERGRITVLDRGRLEEAACECYGIVREQCQRLLGWPPVASVLA